MRVRRRIAYLAAWAVATAVTVTAAALGLRPVLIAAAATRTSPLSAVALRRAAPSPSPPPASASPSPSPSPVAPSSARPTSPVPPPAETWTPAADGFRRAFRTTGGDLVAVCAKGAVQVTEVTPHSGYTVSTSRNGPDSVTVTFTTNRHVSRLVIRWWNGPYAEVTEIYS